MDFANQRNMHHLKIFHCPATATNQHPHGAVQRDHFSVPIAPYRDKEQTSEDISFKYQGVVVTQPKSGDEL